MHPDVNEAVDMTELAELIDDADDERAPEISPDGAQTSAELRVG